MSPVLFPNFLIKVQKEAERFFEINIAALPVDADGIVLIAFIGHIRYHVSKVLLTLGPKTWFG